MVKTALLVRLEAKPGKEAEVEDFLRAGLPLVEEEPATTAWFGIRLGPSTFGIFDAFPDDTHDVTEFESQLEEVTEPVFERKREATMVLRLGLEEVQAVKEIAKARGVEQSELVREWVLEKLGSVRT